RAQEIQANARVAPETAVIIRGAQLEHAVRRAVRTDDMGLLDASVGELTTLPAAADKRVVSGMLEAINANDAATTMLALERIGRVLRAEQTQVQNALQDERNRHTNLITPL